MTIDRDAIEPWMDGISIGFTPTDAEEVPLYVRDWCKKNCDKYGECGWLKANCEHYLTPKWMKRKK